MEERGSDHPHFIRRRLVEDHVFTSIIDATAWKGEVGDKAGRGIYELDGDTLRLCQPHQPTTARPTAFAAPEGSGLHLMVLKKIAK